MGRRLGIFAAAVAVFLSAHPPLSSFAQTCAPLHECGDVNASGKVSASDALLLLKQAVGHDQTLTCQCTEGSGICEAALATCEADLPGAEADFSACSKDLETCNEDVTTCDGSLETCRGNLAACDDDKDTCTGSLESCQTDLDASTGEASACDSDCTASVRAPLRTGQTKCYSNSGPIPCEGTGQDGEGQRGGIRSFTDNGDGTVTDNATLLVWEKLSDDESIHDKDNTYSWLDAIAVKVATLNSESFAGHDDWRLPNINELRSIMDLGTYDPVIFPEFSAACQEGCAASTCSCVGTGFHFASSTYLANYGQAWAVSFDDDGYIGLTGKDSPRPVRAVRGGA